ncbi:MAG: hypothetical protein HUU54_06705 [Ignavibacteriaceae bacterium]|nr:hypothetical protein [Ignavibacteriaceae bacterium]
MAEKKKFLLRIDADLYNMLEKWSSAELRSINSQIEYLLKDALVKSGRFKKAQASGQESEGNGSDAPETEAD